MLERNTTPGAAAMNRSDVPPPGWIMEACRLIDEADEGAPTLTELSEAVGVSPYHLQRKFKQVLGLSPREYAAQRRLDRFKAEVRSGESVSSAMYGAGFGSSSRLYERAGETLGMTPASYGKGGAGARIGFAIADSFLGRLLVASTDRGICRISIGDDDGELVEDLHGEFPAAEIGADVSGLADNLEAVLSILSGASGTAASLPFDLRATAFQWKVWDCLRRIPRGATMTYAEIAAAIGSPKSARAVGRACATNPVAVAIPCHRAVGSDGKLRGYRWGLDRKRKLLDGETESIATDR